MDYDVKIKIGDIEIFESDDTNITTPFISNIRLKNSTSLNAMEIGATASDCLYFTLYNPYKESFDGEKVVLYVSPNGDTSANDLGEIELEVGDEITTEVIDTNDTEGFDDNEEEGEEWTDEEAAEIELTQRANVAAEYEFFNGEDVAIEEITTQGEEEPEWIQIGVYYVFAQNNSSKDNTIIFECLDGFSKMNGIFKPTVAKTSIQNIYNDFRIQVLNNFGIEVDEFEFDTVYNVNVNWNLDCSYRQSIGYMAGLVGGYATFGDDDTLGISFYAFNDRILIDDCLIKYNETSAGEMFVEYGMCDRSINPYKEDIVESGYGQGFNFFNPFVTQEILDEITDYYHGIRYVGAELTLKWHHGIEAGEFIRIMTPEEYANYVGLNNALDDTTDEAEVLDLKEKLNTLGRVILVSNQTIDFSGEATSQIVSICNTDYAKENKVTSPSDAVLRNLYAEMIQADYIQADKVVTEGLQAGTAEIKRLISENVDAEEITTKVIASESLKANYAHVTDGVIDNATIASLEADRITSGTLDADYVHIANLNGKDIINSAVVAKALSNVLAETILGVKVYYQGEEPTGTFNEGDLWYKTITEAENPYEDVLYQYDGNAWVLQDFDVSGGILRSNLITAQEIAANTITAGNILGGSLTIGCMDDSVASAQSEDKRGQMKWLNNALHIGSTTTDGKQYYETKIGGDGIQFKYGSSEENAQAVASIDKDELKITKTIVFNEMKIGKWSWAINPINDHLTVKWGGAD